MMKLAPALCLLLTACLSTDPPQGVLVCTNAADCPDGWFCRSARCFRTMQDMDGGVDDGALDDAGPDAGDAGPQQCVDDTDCGGTTPVCRSQVCGACTADTDCAVGSECVSTGPLTGACAECDPARSGICMGGTPICDLATATCVAGCTSDGDCAPATPICDTATGACRLCQSGAECAGGFCLGSGACGVCDPVTDAGCTNQVCASDGSACVDCEVEFDCPRSGQGYVCGNNQCACVTPGGANCECGPINCNIGEVCDRVTMTCTF